MVRIDPKRFQESITKELDIIKNRVRNLIGAQHWGEEGKYKEAILRNIIKRFLPNNLSIGSGFVIKKSNNEIKISHQIDIIIYDNSIPLLFSEGDFIITTYKNVKGIVEVKTKIRNSELSRIIEKATMNGKVVGKRVFNGILSYEYEDNVHSEQLRQALKHTQGYVNHISLGPDIFIKLWKKRDGNKLYPPIDDCKSDFYNIYRLPGLAFSYFISNLLESACSSKLDDRWWYLYPLPETKEFHREDTVCLD